MGNITVLLKVKEWLLQKFVRINLEMIFAIIDWKQTARFKEPYVKVMEEERELTMMILVDISASMNYGTKFN